MSDKMQNKFYEVILYPLVKPFYVPHTKYVCAESKIEARTKVVKEYFAANPTAGSVQAIVNMWKEFDVDGQETIDAG